MQVAARGYARALALSAYLMTRVTFAQPAEPAPDCPEQDTTLCGRRHFEAGTKAFEAGDFATAAKEFELAIAQRPHPVIRFNLALSLARLGHPSAAIAQLRLTIEDPATDKALKARAEREQRSVEQALSRVTFRLNDPGRERIELDGAPISLAGQEELAIDPGPHRVRIISGTAILLDQELELAPGERVELRVGERSRRIDVVVVPDTPPKQIAPPAPPALPPRKPAPPRRPLPVGWFYAGLGATAVVTGVTVWSGIDTKNALSDYERDLPELSQSEADERVNDGHHRELRTNLLLAGSLACAASTAVLGIWFVDFGDKAQARVSLSPRQLLLSGSF